MAFVRSTTVDASPTGDSVKQAVLDLDADLSSAYTALNQLNNALSLKLDAALRGSTNGVASLDSTTKIPRSQLSGRAYDIGAIAIFPMEDLPSSGDWMECDGTELLVDDYNDLYLAIGSTWGTATQSGYFVLPDFRGAFLRGWDHGAGNDPEASDRTGGDHVGSTQDGALQQHRHVQQDGIVYGYAGGIAAYSHRDGSPKFYTDYYGGDETRPNNSAVMYAIRWR